MKFKILSLAENYLLLDFKNIIDRKINDYVVNLSRTINHNAVIEIIPAYSSILIEFNEKKISASELSVYIRSLKIQKRKNAANTIEIPVVYGGEFGYDLANVAKVNNLTEKQVVDIHTSVEYKVYMMGFLPGFCYLGEVDRRIGCRRKEVPAFDIEKGSVGIAGLQTGIYPSKSPGGWQIIGRTPFKLYRPDENIPFPIKTGDKIKFKAVKAEDVLWI